MGPKRCLMGGVFSKSRAPGGRRVQLSHCKNRIRKNRADNAINYWSALGLFIYKLRCTRVNTIFTLGLFLNIRQRLWRFPPIFFPIGPATSDRMPRFTWGHSDAVFDDHRKQWRPSQIRSRRRRWLTVFPVGFCHFLVRVTRAWDERGQLVLEKVRDRKTLEMDVRGTTWSFEKSTKLGVRVFLPIFLFSGGIWYIRLNFNEQWRKWR